MADKYGRIKHKFHGKRNQKHESFSRPTQQIPKLTLREDQVGITEYVDPTIAGFMAIIKSRYSDFHVNEIDAAGKVLTLNDLTIPKSEADAPLNDEHVTETSKFLRDLVSEEIWLQIKNLAAQSKKDPTAIPIEINVNELSKEQRTEIHALLKQLYPGRLVSTTFNKDSADPATSERYIRITKPKGGHAEKREKWGFPGEYVNFLIHKENMDTSSVASHIAQNLSVSASKVNYAGTKDKRGITTQMFCVKRRKPSDIVAAVRKLRNVHTGNFSFGQNVLKLGDLQGNHFRIALRRISAERAAVEAALVQLRQTGFINYYGLQRFGNCVDVPTYEVGVALMKADYKKACELILRPRSGDLPFLKTIRELWWKTRDAKTAASMFRSNRFIEKKLLDGLSRYGDNDYATALRKLPRNLLLLYPHAFQSLIFNRIASRRIKEFGLKLLPGDLVYRNKSEPAEMDLPDDDCLNIAAIEDEEANSDNEDNPNNSADNGKEEASVSEEDATESEFKQRVRELTAEDIESGAFTIYDVVLSLPGYDIKYPKNILAEWYKETLSEFDLTSEALNHNVKTFKMAGAYRKLLVLPKDISWRFQNYENDYDQLITSDWDRLMNPTKTCDDQNDGSQQALVLEFSLPTATYATMLLRELLKADTSTASQTQLENETKQTKKCNRNAEAAEKEEENSRKRSADTNEHEVAIKIKRDDAN